LQQQTTFQIGQISYYVWLPPSNQTPKKRQIGLFFGHATGIPALAYRALLDRLANELGVIVATYDVPGFGASRDAERGHTWSADLWTNLATAHTSRWEDVKRWLKLETMYDSEIDWIFVGHSIGAWFSIWSGATLGIRKVIALDLVWLPLKMALLWNLTARLGLRSKHPIGLKSISRRQSFQSKEEAARILACKSLFRGFSSQTMYDYVDSAFLEQDNVAALTHDPRYEAAFFYSQPAAMTPVFMSIPKSKREQLQLLFVVGEKSDTCDYKRFPKLKKIFPAAKRVVIPNAGHMFPLVDHDKTIKIIESFITKDI